MERGDSIVMLEKVLPNLPYICCREMLIVIVLRVDGHQRAQILGPDGFLRPIEELLNVTYRFSICLKLCSGVNATVAEADAPIPRPWRSMSTRVHAMGVRRAMRVIPVLFRPSSTRAFSLRCRLRAVTSHV